jgi:LmbE family N-acetylglucosaminyl deacetylase
MTSMLTLGRVRSMVAVGAHPDDIEIAAGGMLLTVAAANPGMRVHYVLLSGTPERQAEARAAATAFLPDADLSFALHTVPDGRLPGYWNAVKQHLQDAAEILDAEVVLSPWVGDAHQDHQLIAELMPTAFRRAFVMQYEIPKWDGDLGRPNLLLPLADDVAHRKVELLHASFPSQKARDWWDDEVFLGLARLRGMECRSRYAEGFFSSKGVLTVA